MTITGNSIHFQGSNKKEWYKATVMLPAGTDPRQLRGTITDCPQPDYVGKVAIAIFKIEDGTNLGWARTRCARRFEILRVIRLPTFISRRVNCKQSH
jgi:hypothetical protein